MPLNCPSSSRNLSTRARRIWVGTPTASATVGRLFPRWLACSAWRALSGICRLQQTDRDGRSSEPEREPRGCDREEVGYSSLFLPETWGRLQNSCSFGHKRISKPREVIFLGSPSEEEFYDKQISCIPIACCIHFPSLFGCWTKPLPPPAPHIYAALGLTPQAPPQPVFSLSIQFSSVAQSCPTLCDPLDARLPYPSPTPGAYSNSCLLCWT